MGFPPLHNPAGSPPIRCTRKVSAGEERTIENRRTASSCLRAKYSLYFSPTVMHFSSMFFSLFEYFKAIEPRLGQQGHDQNRKYSFLPLSLVGTPGGKSSERSHLYFSLKTSHRSSTNQIFRSAVSFSHFLELLLVFCRSWRRFPALHIRPPVFCTLYRSGT